MSTVIESDVASAIIEPEKSMNNVVTSNYGIISADYGAQNLIYLHNKAFSPTSRHSTAAVRNEFSASARTFFQAGLGGERKLLVGLLIG